MKYTKLQIGIIVFGILVAIVLRLLFLSDMEWKWDEKWMWIHSLDWSHRNVLPEVGVMSGGGIVNTGVSTWPFIAMQYLNIGPVDMVLGVSLLNILAIFVFYHSLKSWNPKWNNIILLGIILASTHVLHIVYSRKIWAQDLLPFFTCFSFWGFVNRKQLLGVVVWALSLCLAGQVHMSGFYLAAGMFFAAIWYDGGFKKAQFWLYKFAGTCVLSIVPSIPWVLYVLHNSKTSSASLLGIIKLEYLIRFVSDTVGINIFYSLGHDMKEFFKEPILGFSSYFMFVCLLVTAIIFLYVLILVFVKKEIRNIVWLDRESKFIFLAYMFLPFVLFTLSGIPVRDHYFIVAFPMIQILFTLLLSKINIKMVYLVILLQSIISIQFIYFVHKKDVIQGDYGKPFSKQTFEERTHYDNDTMKITFE